MVRGLASNIAGQAVAAIIGQSTILPGTVPETERWDRWTGGIFRLVGLTELLVLAPELLGALPKVPAFQLLLLLLLALLLLALLLLALLLLALLLLAVLVLALLVLALLLLLALLLSAVCC